MSARWGEIAARLAQAGRAVLVTVIEARGSAPREAGARMLVLPDGRFAGTIGGGALEWQALAQARAMMDEAAPAFRRRDITLGPALGQCCGGRANVALERIGPADLALARALAEAEAGEGAGVLCRPDETGLRRTLLSPQEEAAYPPGALVRLEDGAFLERVRDTRSPLYLFGAGHVGRAVVLALAPLPFRVTWIDAREGAFPDHVPANTRAVREAEPARLVAAMPAGAFVLVMTHSHPLDLDICARVLTRGDAACLGLIGSATKRARFVHRLEAMGLAPEGRLLCPVGLAAIRGKEPACIAAGIAADLLIRREALSGDSPSPARSPAHA